MLDKMKDIGNQALVLSLTSSINVGVASLELQIHLNQEQLTVEPKNTDPVVTEN